MFIIKFRGRLATTKVILAMVLCLVSCKSSIQATVVDNSLGSDPGTLPTSTPPIDKEQANKDTSPLATKELSDSLNIVREYFQSRTVVKLEYSNDLVQPGGTWSLINITNNKTLFEGQGFSLDNTQRSYLEPDSYFMFLAYGNVAQRQIWLYPWISDPSLPLEYGENELLFKSINADSIKQQRKKIYLRDFNVFAISTAAFPSQTQQESGLQGQVSSFMGQPSVNNGFRFLDIGFISMITH